MKVLVSGASGLLGSSIVPVLVQAGHQVVKLVRAPKSGGPDTVPWDPAAGWIEVGRLQGVDAAVHLSGETILGRWTAEKKLRIRESRVGSTRLLAESLAALTPRPRVLVVASATGYYGNRGDDLLTEESASGTGYLAELCREWEDAAAPAADAGIRVVHVRNGLVLAPDGGLLASMLLPFQMGLGGPIGDGRAWWSWIAIQDMADTYRFALEREDVRGAINGVAPTPVTNGEFSRVLGHVLGRPAVVPVPPIALRMLFGEEAAREAAMASARVVPGKLQQAGFQFVFPELEPALRHELGRKKSK
jgi:hypothetical protein